MTFESVEQPDGTHVAKPHGFGQHDGWPAYAFPFNPPLVRGPAGTYQVEADRWYPWGYTRSNGDTRVTLPNGQELRSCGGLCVPAEMMEMEQMEEAPPPVVNNGGAHLVRIVKQ